MANVIHTNFGETSVHYEGDMPVFGFAAIVLEAAAQRNPESISDNLEPDTRQEIAIASGAVAMKQAIEI